MSGHQHDMPNGSAVEELLVSRMRHDLTRRRWWQAWIGRLVIAGSSILVVSTGVTAVVMLSAEPVSETAIVHCLETPSRNLDGTLSGKAASIATPGGVLAITDAVGLCEQMWAAGTFASDDPLDPNPDADSVPTHFTTCVTDDGAAAIVPGRIECSTLDLHPFSD